MGSRIGNATDAVCFPASTGTTFPRRISCLTRWVLWRSTGSMWSYCRPVRSCRCSEPVVRAAAVAATAGGGGGGGEGGVGRGGLGINALNINAFGDQTNSAGDGIGGAGGSADGGAGGSVSG